jgi:hypothetical protein
VSNGRRPRILRTASSGALRASNERAEVAHDPRSALVVAVVGALAAILGATVGALGVGYATYYQTQEQRAASIRQIRADTDSAYSEDLKTSCTSLISAIESYVGMETASSASLFMKGKESTWALRGPELVPRPLLDRLRMQAHETMRAAMDAYARVAFLAPTLLDPSRDVLQQMIYVIGMLEDMHLVKRGYYASTPHAAARYWKADGKTYWKRLQRMIEQKVALRDACRTTVEASIDR